MNNCLYTQQKESLNGLSMTIMGIKYFGLQLHVILNTKNILRAIYVWQRLPPAASKDQKVFIHPSMSMDIAAVLYNIDFCWP